MTEADLARQVHRFYARVRLDPQLGPLFNDAVHHWPDHLETLTHFWSSVMLTSGRYKGSPMAAHVKHLGRMRPPMFDRWLALWRETARETLSPTDADAVILKAERIGESLQLALFFRIEGAVA